MFNKGIKISIIVLQINHNLPLYTKTATGYYRHCELKKKPAFAY